MHARISTRMMYQQSVSMLLGKQARLDHLGKQLTSQERLVTAKDDPVAAGTAIGLDRTLAALAQYGKNANTVQTRLSMQENALQRAGEEVMARAHDLTIQASNGSLPLQARQVIARELTELRQSLLHIANATDGDGRYLFAGSDDATAPFTVSGGRVVYHGDQVRRQIEIAPDAFVNDALPGSEVFMRIRTGDGRVDARPERTNTGTGVVAAVGRSGDAASWNGQRYSVQFTSATTYDVIAADGTALVSAATYTPGEDVQVAGVRLSLDGQPAPGDRFEIGPAAAVDIFATLDALAAALNQEVSSPADQAVLNNALNAGLRDISCANDHLIDARSIIGTQLKQIDTSAELRAANEISLKTSLSALRDLDVAQAMGDYQLEQITLQASHNLFLKMQEMSMFSLMR